jgi:uncharacterized protein YjdB
MKLSMHRHFLSAAFLAVLLSCTGDSPTEAGRTPAQIQATTGSGQTGFTGATLATALVARVTDRAGKPVTGVTVSWTADPAAGTLSATATPTDANGDARTQWTLGSGAGTFTVTASAPGLPPATFTATAALPQPARVEKAGGDGQAAAVATGLADSLVVRVSSAEGRPVPGVRVSWAVSAGGGALSDSAGTTDAAGLARVRWVLGTTAGTQTAEARVAGLAGSPVAFAATARPGSAASVTKAGGDGQSGTVGFALAAPLVVRVADAYGNPVRDAGVTWMSTGGGGSLSPAIATTDSLGMARATWTMGITPGAHTAVAAAAGGTASFGATAALPAPVASVTVSPGTASVRMGDTLRLVATPRDAAGNPLPGREVSWSTSGPTLASVSASGTVTGRAVGTATITATVEGKSGRSVVTVLTAPDSTPPKLKGFTASPRTVDVTSADARVDFTLSIEDALSSLVHVEVGVSHTTVNAGTACWAHNPVSGTSLSGVWQCEATIPRGALAGTWKLQVYLKDAAGNDIFYLRPDLRAAGFPDSLVVTNSAPAGPPTMTALSLSPAAVDVSESAATVDVLISATAGRGFSYLSAGVQAGRGTYQGASCEVRVPASDTTTSQTWKCRLTIPKSSAAGAWELSYVGISDKAGTSRDYRPAELKALGFPSSLQVTSNTEDLGPPTLTAFTLSPDPVDLSKGDKVLEATITGTDVETGILKASVSLRAPAQSPSSSSTHYCTTSSLDGTAKTATVKCSIYFGQSAVNGTWQVEQVLVYDAVGNIRWYTTPQLQAAGFPTTLTVTR